MATKTTTYTVLTKKDHILRLEKQVPGLKNDARYWDLRRTYGDYSTEVLNYLISLDMRP